MSDNTPAGISSSGIEKVEQLVNEKVEERLSDLGIEIRSEDENASLEDVWIAGQPIGKIVVSTQKTAKSVEKEVEKNIENPADNQDGNGGSNEETGSSDTTLEQIADDEQENPAGIQMGPSVERAAAVMSNWFDWSDKAPKGRNIKDGLLNLIETATDESLAWRQIYRACKKVEQLTKGKIVFTKHKRHGWMLIQPSSEGG